MNLVPIVLEDLGTPRARFSLWYVQPGEPVSRGDRVAEIVIPGASIDVAAPVDGTFRECLAFPGDDVESGSPIGFIELQMESQT